MIKKSTLIVSLGLNVLLAGYLLVNDESWPVFGEKQAGSNAPIHIDSKLPAGAVEKTGFLSALKHQYRVDNFGTSQYWRNPAEYSAAHYVEVTKSQAKIRQKLLDRYGESAKLDPFFGLYFRPFGEGYEFLSSDQQLTIFKLKYEFLTAMGSRQSPGAGTNSRPSYNHEGLYFKKVKALLSPEQYFQYALRETMLSHQLRAINFDWTEQEFVSVFQIRFESETTQVTQPLAMMSSGLANDGVSLYDSRIKTALGNTRYVEYLKAQDPFYYRLKQAIDNSANSSASSLDLAYLTYLDYEERIAFAQSQSGAQADLRLLRKERDEAIEDLTGIKLSSTRGQFLMPQKRLLLRK